MGWELLENQGMGALGNCLLGKFGETGPYPQLVAPLWVQRSQWDQTKFTCWRSETIFPNLGELGDLGNQREMHNFRYSAHTSDNIVLPPLPAKAALSTLNEALHEQPRSPVLALLLLMQDAKAKGGFWLRWETSILPECSTAELKTFLQHLLGYLSEPDQMQ